VELVGWYYPSTWQVEGEIPKTAEGWAIGPMKRPVRLTLIAIVALSALFVAGWLSMYSSTSDPKNIQYILWKAHLYKLDLPTATGTMIGDADRDKLVVGKTKSQIEKRFGPLLTPEQATPHLRGCYQDSDWKDKVVLFIANSPWMVVFDGDRATDLVLIKGC
jgi:hypothetical protein